MKINTKNVGKRAHLAPELFPLGNSINQLLMSVEELINLLLKLNTNQVE